jgi:hypothetical protein
MDPHWELLNKNDRFQTQKPEGYEPYCVILKLYFNLIKISSLKQEHENTKVMSISRQPSPIQIMTDQKTS